MPVIEQKTTNKNKVDFDLNRLDKSKITIFSKYPEKLRTDKTVQEAAEIYGYQMSATDTYNRCIGSKRKWNDSPVEALVLKHLELEDRLSALKKRMVTYET